MRTTALAGRAFALAVLGAVFLAPAALGQELNAEIQRVINRGKIGEATVGVSVLDMQPHRAARTLAAIRQDEKFIPASNLKLLTSGAALMVLKPGFVFRTEIFGSPDVLVVQGGGDPALGDPEILRQSQPRLSVDDLLRTLAQSVRAAGITNAPQVIVDDRVFDRQYVHPSWPKDQLDRWYCAQVNGLMFHANVISAFPEPSPDGPGSPPTLRLEPFSPFLEILVKARTTRGGSNNAWLQRSDTSNRLTLFGEVGIPSQTPIEITIHDSATFTGKLLARALSDNGVECSPEAVRLVETQEAVPALRRLAEIRTPIADVLRRCNADSYNLYAEALVKRLGRDVSGESGSWANGTAVVRMLLSEKLGPAFAAATEIADGSGMSRLNRVTPLTLTRWLEVMASDQTLRDPFTMSLSTPSSGTVKGRFKAGELRNKLYAKSGYINGVRSLSGYVVHEATGRRALFSVIVNNLERPEAQAAAKDMQEDIVRVIDRWMSTKASEPAAGG